MESTCHIMIDDVNQVYKIVTKYSEKDALKSLILAVVLKKKYNNLKHFILAMPVAGKDIQCCICVSQSVLWSVGTTPGSSVKKIHEALSELHSIGFAHADVRLANICFNHEYEAVLIDLDRCVRRNMYPALATSFEGTSRMYSKPNRIFISDFMHLHYLLLGWLVAWMLSNDSNCHTRT